MGITRNDFMSAVTKCGFPRPNDEVYTQFNEATYDFSNNELAMLLGQLIHESGGFQYREEIAYKGRPHHGAYVDNVGLPDRDYHGRGYMQLTWGANYKAASEGLGLGDLLLRNPDLVASNTKYSMLTSVWYWRARVRPQIQGREDQFGLTTRAINGAIECSNGYNPVAHKRYQYYLAVADTMNIKNKARENGCYN